MITVAGNWVHGIVSIAGDMIALVNHGNRKAMSRRKLMSYYGPSKPRPNDKHLHQFTVNTPKSNSQSLDRGPVNINLAIGLYNQ